MRFLRIATGYFLAAYCGSLAAWAFLAADNLWTREAAIKLSVGSLFAMQFSVPLTIVQFALFVALAEIYRVRGPIYYVLAGAITGVTALLPFGGIGADATLNVFATFAGAFCGGVYWGVAGRRTGESWRPARGLLQCIGAGCAIGAAIAGAAALFVNGPWSTARDAVLVLGPLFVLTALSSSYFLCMQGAARQTAA
jgi:hypothetical protein